MPKRTDIHTVLIIGSGPIIIGQACEFDYSGTQACKALRELGYRIVLVNSNPATIMTDPDMADITYIEPLNVATLEKIIAREQPDALLPNLGGQSALNLSTDLARLGILEKYGVQVIGVNLEAIERGEDRIAFKKEMDRLGIEMPRSTAVYTIADAKRIANDLGYPVVIRPAYTMGGTGGGMVYNQEELQVVAARGIAASRIGQILVEECVIGWEELELEVVRDADNNLITVCFIENIDPMGVHTGDSFCCAPMLTVPVELQQRLQQAAYAIVESIGVIGGTNVQFGHDPISDRVVVIEINPRTSRSSALASKATGFPIALVSAFLAGGLTLKDMRYWRDGSLDLYTPSGDYVVVKMARWAFEKFRGVEDRLGTQMRAVGEVMSLGKTYKEAFQKAVRGLETGCSGLGFYNNLHLLSLEELMTRLAVPTSERQFVLYEALRKGATVEELHRKTSIHRWFLEQMQELVQREEEIRRYKGGELPMDLLTQAKKEGFADAYLAKILGIQETDIRQQRTRVGVIEGWHAVPVSGVENAAYYYSSYNTPDTVAVSTNPNKVMILGGGPNRIGQGIEFDYCCVHAAFALRDMQYETVMVNCNPETVSTDYDTSDKLYFEPLTVEDVLQIYHKEQPKGVICQFGGQTPLNIARQLEEAGVNILGTSPAVIDLAEDRDQFNQMMQKLGIPMAAGGMAVNEQEAIAIAAEIGYPLMVRPSYVLGGRGMEIVYDELMLRDYMAVAVDVTPDRPILIDRYLENAIEAEADAIADGMDAFVPAVMEHIEQAGIHSGDSACVIPPVGIPQAHISTIRDYTRTIAREMGVVGLMNIQYAICNDTVYVLEANPRASRTVPLVSKVCGIPMARIATEILLGKTLRDCDLVHRDIPHFGVKEAVFPFNMFPEVDPVLGPEMRSTGEVLGMDASFGIAFYKAQDGANSTLPLSGSVLITVTERDQTALLLTAARRLQAEGFSLLATGGTAAFLKQNGITAQTILKVHEGRPNIVDAVKNGEIQLIINTPSGKISAHDDSYIRKIAIKHKIPYITTIAAAAATAEGIAARQAGESTVRSLQEWLSGIC
ncbi:carbamoyl-phosphate synthase large subunit [Desulfobulbus alkaliphilus]|uniref:carbamoyl-phosphate synthase large subunit n=1 Tax=Desulfobulbus alkaliphilus TaxID=869814 RepID=UPI0019640AD3|nr:carbamoyl-phosphate synthase large subunit [Desulfobulbus alkaliphilus]MBM9536546.1 carbamoyl-phosphate synthase large subunit [Desulfobulbus alkaliphilus]